MIVFLDRLRRGARVTCIVSVISHVGWSCSEHEVDKIQIYFEQVRHV